MDKIIKAMLVLLVIIYILITSEWCVIKIQSIIPNINQHNAAWQNVDIDN